MFARFKVIILQLSMRVCIHAFTADADMMWRRWSFEVSYVTKKKNKAPGCNISTKLVVSDRII